MGNRGCKLFCFLWGCLLDFHTATNPKHPLLPGCIQTQHQLVDVANHRGCRCLCVCVCFTLAWITDIDFRNSSATLLLCLCLCSCIMLPTYVLVRFALRSFWRIHRKTATSTWRLVGWIENLQLWEQFCVFPGNDVASVFPRAIAS